ncbi:WhiB family transcriptional regulator [Rhodococcus rhodochrous]|uniref:WhiB family transcriptional regulator n=1 Tax=Rhodococcus rhodochrous TaxID=1829 RepID=UPI0009BC4E2A|nr:WhiB family transcriptional regulator [Rhodococcus rhodochrous]
MNRTSGTSLRRQLDDLAHSEDRVTEHWWDNAACRFFGPAPFFAPDDETPAQRAGRERTAKLICSACPVRWTCLQQALTTGEHHGVWGGTTEHERKRLARPSPQGRQIAR